MKEAFRWDAAQRKHIAQVQSIRRRLNQLPPPLRKVLDLILEGKSNREIAEELDLSVRAIEVRRAKLMQAMKARSLVDLVRQALMVRGARPCPSHATKSDSSACRETDHPQWFVA